MQRAKTDAVDAGSIFRVKNNFSKALVAYSIELVGYPGSFYTFIVDEVNGQSVKSGEERASRVQNMTVGAVPDYVKLTAALYSDGLSVGDPAKVAILQDRRQAMLEATRGVIQRITAAKDKRALIAELNAWAAYLETCGDSPNVGRLMEHMIRTRQLFTVRGDIGAEQWCLELVRYLAKTTEGVYQIDGQGVFDSDGVLLFPEL